MSVTRNLNPVKQIAIPFWQTLQLLRLTGEWPKDTTKDFFRFDVRGGFCPQNTKGGKNCLFRSLCRPRHGGATTPQNAEAGFG